MREPLIVRPATRDDLDPVWVLARALATSSVLDRTRFERSYAQLLSDPGHRLLVGVEGVEVVGYVHALAHPAFHANGPVVWVEELMVTGSRRGRGVGSRLMLAVEDWARDEVGAAYVALATRRAADFYLRIGYQDSARYLRKPLLPPSS